MACTLLYHPATNAVVHGATEKRLENVGGSYHSSTQFQYF
jgi:hypothetical protein